MSESIDRIQRFMLEIDAHVLERFEGDEYKADSWWETPNPSYSNLSPYDMVDRGRINELITFVRAAVESNDWNPCCIWHSLGNNRGTNCDGTTKCPICKTAFACEHLEGNQ